MTVVVSWMITVAVSFAFEMHAIAQQTTGGHDETTEDHTGAQWNSVFYAVPTPDSVVAGITGTHLLITEVGWHGPNIFSASDSAEFIEIYNPTSDSLDLSKYYLADANGYSALPQTGTVNLAGSQTDWAFRFPDGSRINPGEVKLIACDGGRYKRDTSKDADFMLFNAGGATTAVQMVDVGSNKGYPYPGYNLLTDFGEFIWLFFWNCVSDLVCDVDLVYWGSGTGGDWPVLKLATSCQDGPDPDTLSSCYNNDIGNPAGSFAKALAMPYPFWGTRQRIGPEGSEGAGGNGCMAGGRISGTVYHDLNGNGQPDSLEPGLPGWAVYISGQVSDSTSTDYLGNYSFASLPSGTYEVSIESNAGCNQTFPAFPGTWTVVIDDSMPIWTCIDFLVICYLPCDLAYKWRKGPPIQVIRDFQYWPPDDTLRHMRPGDVIGISLIGEDYDFLVQKCVDCRGDSVVKKWGPYSDLLEYEWKLTGPGTLIKPSGLIEATAVMYQIPICDWQDEYEVKVALIDLSIKNQSAGAKALDDSLYAGRLVVSMIKDCTSPLPGGIRVLIGKGSGSPKEPEQIEEFELGTCLPQQPIWERRDPISAADILVDEAPNLCPDYLTLLSVLAADVDSVSLSCVDYEPYCVPESATILPLDPLRYTWSLEEGKGSFPLGTAGATVVFRRSRSAGAKVRCTIRDSQTQFIDYEVIKDINITKAKPPQAFVGVGDIQAKPGGIPTGIPLWSLRDAAEEAEKKYASAGYAVTVSLEATQDKVKEVVQNSCYQALWITGHGWGGSIDLSGGKGFGPAAVDEWSFEKWGCYHSPFIREMVLLGCKTYTHKWKSRFVCALLHTFNHLLIAAEAAGLIGLDPYTWEVTEHFPPPAHNLSAL
ncbi:MAG: SdrD B-like domain-containing protein [Candidatus Eisenbacteria bacterium]|nr:SdrD B-like domain-containing protein [Candidatus Eisenbacteria bacterium]